MEKWRTKRNAPPPGTALDALDALPDGRAREYSFGETPRQFSMLVIRRGNEVRAYVNLCPHQWLPLTFRSNGVVSDDAGRIVCSNHQAEFAVDDGRALSGPVEVGCTLIAIPLTVDAEGLVRIGGEG